MYVPLLATMLAVASTPAATKPENKLESISFFSMPLLFGADAAIHPTTTSTGFFWGLRPELIAGWRESHPSGAPLGFGVGGYGEIVGSTGTSQVWFGGGATVVGYFGYLGVAASAGIDIDWVHAVPNASPVFGLFVGFRTADIGRIDFPFGLRVDYRPSLGDVPTTVIVSAQLDLLVGLGSLVVGGMVHGLMH